MKETTVVLTKTTLDDINGIDASDIYEDVSEVSKLVLKTPLVRLPWLDAPNRKVWAKLECNQLTNSFKARGAFNAIRKIDPSITIVTASAGNHGLAIAYAASKLGRKSKIFVPANSSELKLRRLISMGAEVSPVGKDLYESTVIARKVAEDIESVFISPFSQRDVILGQGSVAVEALSQHDSFDQVLVPLGGGGLLIGCALVFNDKLKNCEIRAIHPKAFQRHFGDNNYKDFSKAVYPTIADGLAVQHSHDDYSAALARDCADSIDQVSEHDIELGVAAMLNNEGLLVEGGGAIGIAALINDPDGEIYKGDVLVLITGGNIATSSLMHALAAHTDNPKLARLLGHRSVSLPAEAVKYKGAKGENTEKKSDQVATAHPEHNIWSELISNTAKDIEAFSEDLKRHKEYVVEQNLNYQPEIIEHLKKEISSAQKLIELSNNNDIQPWEQRDIFRLLIQQYSFIKNSLAWCSASTDQVGRVMFFDPAENVANSLNYDRYGSLLLREREFSMQQALGLDVEKTDLLLTSSGQAAYTVVESFLLRHALSAKPTVVTCPYIYFEALEQLESLKHVKTITSESWDIKDMIDLVEESSAEALFLDPLANLGTLHMTDFREFAKQLEGHDWSSKWIITDGTMVSGGLNLFEVFNKPNHPQVLYYESGSKYMQFGLDLQMAGVVVCPREYSAELATYRRNTGTVMYQSSITKFPRYSRQQFLSRMGTLTRNAEIMRDTLKSFDMQSEKIEIAYPKDWQKFGWSHGGGIVSVTMAEEGLNNRACLDYLIELILKECAAQGVSITKGVSFGFSTTRISAAAAMAQSRPPFLRFSIGEESEKEMRALCQAVTRAFERFFEDYANDLIGVEK
jgi:threonine dehydratase